MQIKIPVRNFKCSESLKPHLVDIFEGEYDVPLRLFNPIVLDCGANVGAFSIWACHRFPGAKVYAYEPNPIACKAYNENTKGYNVHLTPQAVGEPGWRVFYHGVNNLGEASFYKGSGVTSDLGFHTEALSPTVMPVADIIKIDTEGCEEEILRPLIEAGRSFKAVMLEYHRVNDRRILDDLLKDYIFVGAKVFSSGRGVVLYIHKDWIGDL